MVTVTTTTTTAGSPSLLSRRPHRGIVIASVLAAWIIIGTVLRGRDTLYLEVSRSTGVHMWFQHLRDRVDAARANDPVFAAVLDSIRGTVAAATTFLQNLIAQPSYNRPVPMIGWLGVLALLTFAAYAFGNLRVAGLTAVGLVTVGLLGLWRESMDTLAQVITAVLLSVLIGIPLGIWMGLSRWVTRIFTPVLDAMQAMPPLAYIAPIALFFLIGAPAAVIVTMVYSLPPVIRLTSHGIAQVRGVVIEASRSAGATGWQVLRTVRLPLAKRTIVVGVNQTTMAALSMVMIAVLIGSPGLGPVVLNSLARQNVGRAFVAGLAIVIFGVLLDRITTAASERAEASYRAGVAAGLYRRRRLILAGAAVLVVVAVYYSYSYKWASIFPGPTAGGVAGNALAGAFNTADDWVRLHLFPVTDAIKNGVSYGLLNPLQAVIAESPWYVSATALVATAWAVAGLRAVPVAAACVGLLLGSGLWQASMETLTSVLVATVLAVAFGLVLGVWLAQSRRADLIVRPILDAAQAMPAFVYLVPAVALFNPTRFSAIVAGLVFAVPVVTKIVADGIRGVPVPVVEAATASGSNRWQLLGKVQLPLALPTLAVAANQGLIYVLSVVVLGGMVGAGALGYLSVYGFSQSEAWGKGFVAGLNIVVLAIMLDRVTQRAVRRAQGTHR